MGQTASLKAIQIMFIQTEPTPNPATMKFLPGRDVMAGGTMDFADAKAAERSPLAQALFAVDGVERVFFGGDFVSVTKSGGEWEHLKPAVLGAIMEHYSSGASLLAENAASAGAEDEEDSDIVLQIKDLLETRVRPAVAQDGGDIVFQGYDDGIVYLHMQGACSGCPSSTMTLKYGIENLLKHYIPEILEVRPV